ncbi:MAG TPA: N-acetyltransferase [Caulobacteraceae bacterium]|nr:N-acetyltransferase [Caulobacteraceae bacterium]
MSLDPAPALPPLALERPQDDATVERLVLGAFGPGRFAKAAERLREGRTPLLGLSFVAWERGRIVGCVRQWAVRVGETPAIMLGPFAVDATCRSQGLGAALIEQACEAATAAGHAWIVLVGDVPYFGPLGFVAAPGVRMPGPVDQRRVLVRPLRPGLAPTIEGLVSAA